MCLPTVDQDRRAKAIEQKLDRLDDAFLFAQSIDRTSYERQRDRLREEMTLAQIGDHAVSFNLTMLHTLSNVDASHEPG